jgi:amino acid transporter
MVPLIPDSNRFGTMAVYLTALATILGAILFLRFGYAVGTLGFAGVVLIIILGHFLTIPTAFAISELATNKRVEGGGEYYIISRSFGLNIGATIGIALYLSQAISVAFYIIAFTEAFQFLFKYFSESLNINLPRQIISIPVTLIIGYFILKNSANSGIKMLYIVILILAVSLIMFFIGKPIILTSETIPLTDITNLNEFFTVFAIVFPAFTGMTAGVGLSGNLKNPARSIPIGTIAATFTGMIIYMFVVYKLAISASSAAMLEDQLIMSRIALGGSILIPLGLAASTLSSALGSALVAPRTLQALAFDSAFPSSNVNRWLSRSRTRDHEPVNASLITILIAVIFVAAGSINAVAEIISMFYLVTYGSLCLISFLNHFGSSPSYRPSFRSKWYFSLAGFMVAIWVMLKINAPYALGAILIIIALYWVIKYYHSDRRGLESLFANALFQVNRNLQVYLQKSGSRKKEKEWRPSAICISKDSFSRAMAFQVLNWISYRYGFATYLHRIDGYYSKVTTQQAREELSRLIELYNTSNNQVFVDTIISPSYTSAIVQAIQVPGISGMENNMVIFEYDKEDPCDLPEIVDNIRLIQAGDFDICLLASSRKKMFYRNGIHVWINSNDVENSSLEIMLSFIIIGHPDWKKSTIKVFDICKPEQYNETCESLAELVKSGRLPITEKNVEIIVKAPGITARQLINEKSPNAALVIKGLHLEGLKRNSDSVMSGYEGIGTILFVNSHNQKEII